MAPVKDGVDELVQSVSCHNPRPVFLHGYIGPFVSMYGLLMYSWFTKYSQIEQQEMWFITVAATIAFQILAYLFCLWSVDVKCFLAYSRVTIIIPLSILMLLTIIHHMSSGQASPVCPLCKSSPDSKQWLIRIGEDSSLCGNNS